MRQVLALAALALLAAAAVPSATKPGPLAAADARARQIVKSMTLAEKIGQMTQAEHGQIKDPADVEALFLGSVLSGGNSDPRTNSLKDWTDLVDGYQARALRTRLRIPLLYGIDAVHGHGNVEG